MLQKTLVAASLMLVFSPLAAVRAQSVNIPDAPTESDRVVVTDVPIEQNIMPTNRPTNSVYGTDTPVLDTPRNITIISTEQLSAIDIQDPRDFEKLSSDSFTQSNFGAPGQPVHPRPDGGRFH